VVGYIIAFVGAFLYSYFGQHDKTKKGAKKKGKAKLNAIASTLTELAGQVDCFIIIICCRFMIVVMQNSI
jgi:hypothetical protein